MIEMEHSHSSVFCTLIVKKQKIIASIVILVQVNVFYCKIFFIKACDFSHNYILLNCQSITFNFIASGYANGILHFIHKPLNWTNILHLTSLPSHSEWNILKIKMLEYLQEFADQLPAPIVLPSRKIMVGLGIASLMLVSMSRCLLGRSKIGSFQIRFYQ